MATAIEGPPTSVQRKRLNFFERYLTVWVAAPGSGERIHHSFDDPAAAPIHRQPSAFRSVRDQMRIWLESFIRDESLTDSAIRRRSDARVSGNDRR